MKKAYFFILLFGLALIIFLILIRAFPKNVSLLPALMILMVLDGYLWFSIKDWTDRLTRFNRYAITGLYWLPLAIMITSMIISFRLPFLSWNIPLRTYIPGMILTIYVCKVFPIITLVLADIYGIFRYLTVMLLKGKTAASGHFNRRRWILNIGWATGSALFVMMLIGMAWWNYDFRVKRETIVLPELPPSFNGLTIVQISDIHLGSWTLPGKLERAVEIVNGLHPDLIFFTGDLANFSTDDVLPFEAVLSHLKARTGIFAIMGNHDYGDYIQWSSAAAKEKNLQDLYLFYKRLGWKLLLNEHSILKRGSADSIAVIGVHNWGSVARFQRLGDMGKADQGCENVAVQLLLTHDPSHWEYVVSRRYRNIDISFSGHTHGFQFGIECCGIKWSPAKYLYTEWAGLYSKPVPGAHPQYLYVNRGLGSIGYPGRIGILPEITLFTLRRNR